MTPKQQERIEKKIKKIKAALAADKNRWGGFYDDSGGIRYLPPRYYIQLENFSGGLRYMNWFNKNFPDDCGYPDFMFEWTIILFKTGRLKEAEKKAFLTFTRNTYVFDKFFCRLITPIDKWEGSNLEVPDFAINYFKYSHDEVNLLDFAAWLDNLTRSEKFVRLMNNYIDIHKRLKGESDHKKRKNLIEQADMLENEL